MHDGLGTTNGGHKGLNQGTKGLRMDLGRLAQHLVTLSSKCTYLQEGDEDDMIIV